MVLEGLGEMGELNWTGLGGLVLVVVRLCHENGVLHVHVTGSSDKVKSYLNKGLRARVWWREVHGCCGGSLSLGGRAKADFNIDTYCF